MSDVKQAVAARLARIPANMAVLRPALDKLTKSELVALNQALMLVDSEKARLKRKVQRGY
jgi:hypothetical protein